MVFVGGKLSLKGDKKKKSKKKKLKSKHDKKKSSRDEEAAAAAAPAATNNSSDDDDEDEMTEAERKAQKYKQKAEKKDLEKAAKQSHRDRVEEFSQKLSELTELNDIPRVSFMCMLCCRAQILTELHVGDGFRFVLLLMIFMCSCYARIYYRQDYTDTLQCNSPHT